MAITLDHPLGSLTPAGTTTSSTITTTAAASAGSRVVVCVSWFNSTNANMSVTVGGVSAAQDTLFSNGSDRYAVYSLVVAGGLAISSSIVATQNATGAGGLLLAACSYLGTTAVDTASSATATGTGFSSGSATDAVADALFVGGAGSEAVATTVGGTNTNGTSRFDIYSAGAGQGLRMLDLIVSSIGARALTGTWASSSTATTGALVIYSGTGTATGIPDLIMAPPHR